MCAKYALRVRMVIKRYIEHTKTQFFSRFTKFTCVYIIILGEVFVSFLCIGL